MAKKRFYGVAGTNGYGVYDDYNKVLEARPYIKGFMVKGFPYYKDAERYSIETYKRLVYGTIDVNGTYEIRRMNRFYRKNLVRGQKNVRDYKKSGDVGLAEKRICPFSIVI